MHVATHLQAGHVGLDLVQVLLAEVLHRVPHRVRLEHRDALKKVRERKKKKPTIIGTPGSTTQHAHISCFSSAQRAFFLHLLHPFFFFQATKLSRRQTSLYLDAQRGDERG